MKLTLIALAGLSAVAVTVLSLVPNEDPVRYAPPTPAAVVTQTVTSTSPVAVETVPIATSSSLAAPVAPAPVKKASPTVPKKAPVATHAAPKAAPKAVTPAAPIVTPTPQPADTEPNGSGGWQLPACYDPSCVADG